MSALRIPRVCVSIAKRKYSRVYNHTTQEWSNNMYTSGSLGSKDLVCLHDIRCVRMTSFVYTVVNDEAMRLKKQTSTPVESKVTQKEVNLFISTVKTNHTILEGGSTTVKLQTRD